MRLICESRQRAACELTAEWLCSNGHILCIVHARDARSKHRERKTDRICSICGSVTMISFLDDAPLLKRRAGDFGAPVVEADPVR